MSGVKSSSTGKTSMHAPGRKSATSTSSGTSAAVATVDANAETWMHLDAEEVGRRLLRLAKKVMLTDDLEVNQPLMEAGMDSIESVDFRNQLERRLPGLELPGALILEYPSIRDLREFVLRARSAYFAMLKAADEQPAAEPLLDAELQAADGSVCLPGDFPQASSGSGCGGTAVLLTGATGFLGVNLLADLLALGSGESGDGRAAAVSRVYVLIRAANAELGLQRVEESFESHCLKLQPKDAARIEVMPTEDLSLPKLGLAAEDYERLLSAGVSTIIHNAAAVNWFKRYEQLRSTNVYPTLVLLRLAAELGAKFGYVSSISTLPLARPELALNEACANSWQCNTVLKMSGYSQTKWMSEQLCFAAARHGVAVTVFRMPFIVGHTQTGCMNLQDTPARLISAIVELQEAPVTVQLDCIAVDVVARVTVRVSLRPQSCGVSAATGLLVDGDASQCVVHIAARYGKMGIEKVFEQLRRSGYSGIRWVSRNDWVHRAMERQTAAAPIQVFDRLFNRPALVNTMQTGVLDQLDVPIDDIQEVSQRHLEVMLGFLCSRGALPEPSGLPTGAAAAAGAAPAGWPGTHPKRRVDFSSPEPTLDYEACKRCCEEDMVGYHAAVAARNLHWYNVDRGAWLTWRRTNGDLLGKLNAGDGAWHGFHAMPTSRATRAGKPATPAALAAEEEWLPWTCTLDDSAEPFYRWFVGGKTNACLNEVDRHVAHGHGSEIAHIVDLLKTGTSGPVEQQLTRRQLLEEVATAAKVLQRPPFSLQMGDRVLLVLPTCAQQLVWTEACKRLGIIYSACTPGMVASVLAERVIELQPKVLITMQNIRARRWAPSVASALNDFVATSVFLQGVQFAAGQLGSRERKSVNQLIERTFGGSGMPFGTAVAEAHAILQDTFGSGRCVNLSVAMATLMREVTSRLQADRAKPTLAAFEESVLSFCHERVSSAVKVLVADEEDAYVAGGNGRTVLLPEYRDQPRERMTFGNTSSYASSELWAQAKDDVPSMAASDSSAGGTGTTADDVDVLVKSWREASQPVPLEANFPLFVCYTSGSTSRPMGIVHCHGYTAGIAETLRWSFGAMAGKDRLLTLSHPGWIVGQSYMYSAPLCARVTSVALEGSPIRPTHMRFAEAIVRHRVTILKTGSTFLREIMSYPEAVKSLRQDFDLAAYLRVVAFCGEPLVPQVQAFSMQHLCAQPINAYWSTEHGGIVWTRFFGSKDQLLVANAHTWPLPWIRARVLSSRDGQVLPWDSHDDALHDLGLQEEGPVVIAQSARPGQSGDVGVLQPFPYLFRCVWGDADRVLHKGWKGDVETYLSRYWHRVQLFPEVPRWCFIQRDWALEHPGGAFTFHGRSDEVMLLGGVIVSTETLETAIQRDKHLHGAASPVGDCAVVGHPHKVYGEMPLAFVTPAQPGMRLREGDVERLSSLIYEAVGNVGMQFIVVPELPRTQTGKIMRKVLRALIRDDQATFMQAAKAVRNLACLRYIQSELQEWRKLHANFGSVAMLKNNPSASRVLDGVCGSDSGGSDEVEKRDSGGSSAGLGDVRDLRRHGVHGYGSQTSLWNAPGAGAIWSGSPPTSGLRPSSSNGSLSQGYALERPLAHRLHPQLEQQGVSGSRENNSGSSKGSAGGVNEARSPQRSTREVFVGRDESPSPLEIRARCREAAVGSRRESMDDQGTSSKEASPWELTVDLRQVICFVAGVAVALFASTVSTRRRNDS